MEMPWTAIIPIVLFAAGLVVALLKHISNLDTRLVSLIAKFDERTVHIGGHLSKIDNVLRSLVDSVSSIDHLKDMVADHEGRLRNLKSPMVIDAMMRDIDDHEDRLRTMEGNMRSIKDGIVIGNQHHHGQ